MAGRRGDVLRQQRHRARVPRPGKCSDSACAALVTQLFEGLTRSHPDDGHPVQGVAQRWEKSDDNRLFRFHLRPVARWSDGRPVTAGDFEYAWKRALAPATASRAASNLSALENAEDFRLGKLRVVRGIAPSWPSPQSNSAERDASPGYRLTCSSGSGRRELHARRALPQPRSTWGLARQAGLCPKPPGWTLVGAGRNCPAIGRLRWGLRWRGAELCPQTPGHAHPHGPPRSAAGCPKRTSWRTTASWACAPPTTHAGGRAGETRALLPRPHQLARLLPRAPRRHRGLRAARRGGHVDAAREPGLERPLRARSLGLPVRDHDEGEPLLLGPGQAAIHRIVWLEVEDYHATMNLYKTASSTTSATAAPAGGVPGAPRQQEGLPPQRLPLRLLVRAQHQEAAARRRAGAPRARPGHRQAALVDRVTRGGQRPATHYVPDFTGSGYAEEVAAERAAGGSLRGAPLRSREGARPPGRGGLRAGARGRRVAGAGVPAHRDRLQQRRGATGRWPSRCRRCGREPRRLGDAPQPGVEGDAQHLPRRRLPGDALRPDRRLRPPAHLPRPLLPRRTRRTSPAGATSLRSHPGPGRATADPRESIRLYRAAEAIALAAMPRIPLYFYTRSSLVKPWVRGFRGSKHNPHAIQFLWIDPAWHPTRRARHARLPAAGAAAAGAVLP